MPDDICKGTNILAIHFDVSYQCIKNGTTEAALQQPNGIEHT